MLWKSQIFVFVLMCTLSLFNKINAEKQQQQQQKEHFKRFNNDASGLVDNINSHYNMYKNNNKRVMDHINMHKQQPIQRQQQQNHQQQQLQESNAWSPLSTHKNWYILQATSASNNAKHQEQQQQRLPVNYYAYNHRFNHSSGNYKQVVTQTAASANKFNKRFDDNEVTDEKRGVQQAADVSQPYVLAISKTMRRGTLLTRQNMPKPMSMPLPLPRVDSNVLPKDITRRNTDETFLSTHSVDADIIQQQKHEQKDKHPQRRMQDVTQVPTQFIENNDISAHTKAFSTRIPTATTAKDNVVNGNENVAAAASESNVATTTTTTTATTDDDNVDVHVVDDVRLNELLLPLDNALDKVRIFCDIVKNIISEENNNNIDDDYSSWDDEDEATDDSDDDLTKIASASKEIQGRDVALTTTSSLSSSASSPLLSTTSLEATRSLISKFSSTTPLSTSYAGTGRKVKKLKKKFRKLLLPLLIAYKLKFLTLIPVLIGGLTLLVGTTGLAGFFFALFTAVMSLKSTGGSKSIIVKKI